MAVKRVESASIYFFSICGIKSGLCAIRGLNQTTFIFMYVYTKQMCDFLSYLSANCQYLNYNGNRRYLRVFLLVYELLEQDREQFYAA